MIVHVNKLTDQTDANSFVRVFFFYIFGQITLDDRVHLVEAIAYSLGSKVIIMFESIVVSRMHIFMEQSSQHSEPK